MHAYGQPITDNEWQPVLGLEVPYMGERECSPKSG